MDAKDIRNLSEAYNSVYQPQYISEEVEIATEYFYEMGLNEYGIDILIEELGEDEFVDWVDEIVEESYLEEASQTRLQKMADKKNKILVGPKGSRPQSTTKAAIKKYGGTVRGGISGGVSGVVRKKAATTAIKSQPTTSSTPTQTRMGIAGRLGAALGGAVKKAKQDIELTKKTAQTVGKAVKTGIDALNTASDSKLSTKTREFIGNKFSDLEKAAPKIGGTVGKLASRIGPVRDTYKAGQRLGRALRGEECDYILSYLLDEGYAETVEAAEVILMNMGDEWIADVLDEGFKPTNYNSGTGRKYNQIKKQINKLEKSGKGGDAQAVDFVNRMQDDPEGRQDSVETSRRNKSALERRAREDAQRDSRRG